MESWQLPALLIGSVGVKERAPNKSKAAKSKSKVLPNTGLTASNQTDRTDKGVSLVQYVSDTVYYELRV